MSCAFELRATKLRTIAEELARPTLTLPDLVEPEHVPPAVADDWEGLQRLVASTIADGRPVTTDEAVSHYIAAIIRQHSYWWHTLVHSEDESARFRSKLTEDVADVIGIPIVAGLVRRQMAGLVADSHPYYGWATVQELGEALTPLSPTSVPPSDDQTMEFHAFLQCMRAAVDRDLDLVTIYHRPHQPTHPDRLVV